MIPAPETFVRATLAREGEAGAGRLDRLPSVVGDLLDRWGCLPDGDVLHGGVAVVVPVRRHDRCPAVLKVSFPHPGNIHGPDAFAAWGGHGAVLLYERDDNRFAMLLERVRPDTLGESDNEDVIASIAGELSRRLAVPAPGHLPRLRDRVDLWEQQLRIDSVELDHSLSRRCLHAALNTLRDLGRTQPGTLVHGDLHARNILRAEHEPWLAVDPKGYAGDPAYDGGTLVPSTRMPQAREGEFSSPGNFDVLPCLRPTGKWIA